MTEKLKLCSLREYRTRDGRPYLRGFIGDCKLLIFRDDKAEVPTGCQAVWAAFLEAAESRVSSRQEPAPSPRASTPRYHPPAVTQGGRKVSTKPRRKAAIPADAAPFSDVLDDILPTTAERAGT